MADNEIDADVIGVAMDGLGFGADGRMWGGEFFAANLSEAERIAHLDYMPMPGGVESDPRTLADGGGLSAADFCRRVRQTGSSICSGHGHPVVAGDEANDRNENKLPRDFEHGPFVRRRLKFALSAPRGQL